MTTHEFAQFVLRIGAQSPTEATDEAAAKEIAQLVSGSLIYRLYESLIINGYNMDDVTEHLEMLCDAENHFGLLYFIFVLTDAVNEELPDRFAELIANRATAPYFASALIEDWLDFHEDYGN
ncbi:MAG: hypothetical protein LBS91_00945 [Clostridiales Family XIII bacterium]|jgi:hypothetical protein|nr:hypothetical protein [Clostridiales Family XIII bacterium]